MNNFNFGEYKSANSNVERKLTAEIWGLLETLVKLHDVKTNARALIMREINIKMGLL